MVYFGFFQSRLKSGRPFSEYTQTECEEAQSQYLDAISLDDNHDYAGAIAKYSAALDIVPIFYEALDNRGLCYMKSNEFAAAIPNFEASTQIKPDSPLALVALVKCYREMGKNVNAMHVARYCIEKWPNKSPFPNWDEMFGPHEA